MKRLCPFDRILIIGIFILIILLAWTIICKAATFGTTLTATSQETAPPAGQNLLAFVRNGATTGTLDSMQFMGYAGAVNDTLIGVIYNASTGANDSTQFPTTLVGRSTDSVIAAASWTRSKFTVKFSGQTITANKGYWVGINNINVAANTYYFGTNGTAGWNQAYSSNTDPIPLSATWLTTDQAQWNSIYCVMGYYTVASSETGQVIIISALEPELPMMGLHYFESIDKGELR